MNLTDKSNVVFYYTVPQLLPGTITDHRFLGIYNSVNNLPTSGLQDFNLAGIAGTKSIYAYLGGSWQYVGEYLHDAYRYLVQYEGSSFATATGTKWTSVFNDIASSSTLMNEFANDQNCMNNLTSSYTAMNAMTTLVAASAFQNSSIAGSTVATLVSNINAGKVILGGGKLGTSTALGLNALLVFLSANNGSAMPAPNSDGSAPTLFTKIENAFGSLFSTISTSSSSSKSTSLPSNSIILVDKMTVSASSGSSGKSSGGAGTTTGGTDIINIPSSLTISGSTVLYPNSTHSGLIINSNAYFHGGGWPFTLYFHYATYTPQ